MIDRVRVRDIVAHKRRVQLRHARALGPLERSRLLGILEHLRIELEPVQHPIWRSLARDDPLAECVCVPQSGYVSCTVQDLIHTRQVWRSWNRPSRVLCGVREFVLAQALVDDRRLAAAGGSYDSERDVRPVELYTHINICII